MSQPKQMNPTAKGRGETAGGSEGGGGAAGGNRYRGTLNLPQTAFPMKANLVQNEPASLARWAKMGLYATLREARTRPSPENRGRWAFHDGPPYANGTIHLGHLLNKVLKDVVVRLRTMMGYDVDYIPGWDCHGLPIEHKVMTDLLESGKAAKLETLSEDDRRMAIRRECRKSAEKFIGLQAKQMQRLLTLADYDRPYMTMSAEFEAGTLEVFADLVAAGLVYRALKPVHWSVANRTALAEAELEYYDREDPSIYVNFEVEDGAALACAFGVDPSVVSGGGDGGGGGAAGARKPAAIMIWTTTPWTLPANLAVAVHLRFTYVLVELAGRVTVVAEGLLEKVASLAGSGGGSVRRLGTCVGEKLIGLRYRHPFCARTGAVVAAEYVTLEDGTGLVHTAPGHGADDYRTGLANGLETYCPVRGDGTFDTADERLPEWLGGMSIWDANPKVIEQLRGSGHLYHHHNFTHSYPHDWRGKTPVIFRATEQWFVAVDKQPKRSGGTLRDLALAATGRSVAFYPEWGRNRMRGMLESRPDWCISRQRAWGLPIPAFKTASGEAVMTERMVRAVSKVVREHGSDVWMRGSTAELLKHYDVKADPEAPRGLDVGALKKMDDTFDVWFESGSSWHTVMEAKGLADLGAGRPCDLYLEGSDQHRGWFQVSLLTALGAHGVPPYKGVLTHGFTVDKDGRKMSKSLGNTIEVEDLLTKFGADVCRWWVASLSYENEIKVDMEFFNIAGESYRKVRNTLRFLLSNLSDYPVGASAGLERVGGGVSAAVSAFQTTSVDAWVVSEYNRVAKTAIEAYDRYDFRVVHGAIYDFCNTTLSAVYCAAVKDRLYCDRADSPRRRRTQAAMWALVEGVSRLIEPFLPHTADEVYRALPWPGVEGEAGKRCVHLETFIDRFDVNVDAEWGTVMTLREEAMAILERARAAGVVENPMDAEVRVADVNGVLARFAERAAKAKGGGEDFRVDFADLLGVSRVVFVKESSEAKVVSLVNEPRCERSWKRDGTVKVRSDGGMLSDRDAKAVGVG